MSDRVTVKDVERVAEFVSGHMETLGLLRVADGERLVIESGSATGGAWKVFVTGGEYGGAWHVPPFGVLRSDSARELRDKLSAVLSAFDAVTSCGHRVECVVTA